MSSKKPTDLLDLERDIPTTERDTERLAELRSDALAAGARVMQRLHDALPEAAKKPDRKTFEGYEPFEL